MKTFITLASVALLSLFSVTTHASTVMDCVADKFDARGIDPDTAAMMDWRMTQEECEAELGGAEPIPQVYDSPGFRIELTHHPVSMNFATVNIQSATDDLVVTGVVVNRGNCETVPINGGISLNFGQKVGVNTGCRPTDILEVDVNSNRGEWTFTFH
jgi:hypothetical protein